MRSERVLQLTCLLFMCTLAARAQFDQGQIAGTVKDRSDAVVPGARVTALNLQSGLARSVETGQNGVYILTNMAVGTYEVSVEAAGFKKFIKTNVTVNAATRTTLDAMLELGLLTESVTVAASATQIQQETALIGRVVDSRQISDLALNGRNPINLALLKAGVVGGNFNKFNPTTLSDSFNINGGRGDGNTLTIDGVNSMRTRGDRAGGAQLGVFNVDTIQEVQILTSTYPAEYGRAMDGLIRFVTKSGTRDFHGALWQFLRNSALDANSWTRNLSPNRDESRRAAPFRFNQPGYSIGGPVVIPGGFNRRRDKLFFYVSQEWLRYRKEATSTATVPTAAMKQGDFSELLVPTNAFFNRAKIIKDPLSGAPFPNNGIPASRLSRNGIAMLNAYPLAVPGFQQGTNNWIQSRPNPQNSRKDFFRFDYYARAHRLSFSGTHFGYFEDAPFRGSFDVANTRWNRPNMTGTLSLTSSISPTVMNVVTFSAANDVVGMWLYPTAGKELYLRGQYGIDFQYVIPGPKTIQERIPTINVTGLTQLDGSSKPGFSSGPMYTWDDSLTLVLNSAHTLKFGASFEQAQQNNNDQVAYNQNGWFDFLDTGNPSTTGVALGNVALGIFNGYNEIGPAAYTLLRSKALETFAQDTWKATPNLTLEYGLRAVWHQPYYAKWNDISNFDERFYSTAARAVVDPKGGFIVSGDSYNGIVLPGKSFPESAKGRAHGASLPGVERLFHNLPRALVEGRGVNFSPRFGLAYRFIEKTVLRVGAGAFTNRTMHNNGALFRNAPNQPRVDIQNGIADVPGGSALSDFPFKIGALDRALKYETAYSYSFSVQRELSGAMVLDLSYVGKTGNHLSRIRNINQIVVPGTIQANPGVNPNALVPWLGLGTISQMAYDGRSNYNSFQLTLDRRFNSGLGFGVSYTFSKTISDLATPYDAYHYVKAIDSAANRPHMLNVSYIYELPFLRNRKNLAGKALGNWQISGVTFFRSGAPLSVTDATDVAGVGSGSGQQPWDLVGDPRVSGDRGLGKPWFNPAAFAMPAAGKFGNAGLNILEGPSFQNWDLALFKNFPIVERLACQFRFEVFNFPNHPNLNNPGTNPRTGTFAVITSKTGERNVQFGLKLLF